MILYFSGTGNSTYIAKRIGAMLEEPVYSMNDYIKDNKTISLMEDEKLVVVTPIYGWRIPRVVEEWIKSCNFAGKNKTYFVLNCGSDIGNAGQYARRLCAVKKLTYMGCAEIVMPENYVVMYPTPPREEAKRIIAAAEDIITKSVEYIRDLRQLPERRLGLTDYAKSGIVNRPFYKLIVHADKFYATEACISCGKCVDSCPLNNITLQEGKPVWDKNCTHCMACICKCPVTAIEYGKKSIGKPRYLCPYS